jgi:hypothetical protein
MTRPPFCFLCVARWLKCPAFRPPRAVIKQKLVSCIHKLFTRWTGHCQPHLPGSDSPATDFPATGVVPRHPKNLPETRRQIGSRKIDGIVHRILQRKRRNPHPTQTIHRSGPSPGLYGLASTPRERRRLYPPRIRLRFKVY